MKKSIEWHEECFKNRLRAAADRNNEIARLETEIEKQNTENGLYAAQIDLAKKEDKDGFDRDKYAIKRLCV